MPILSNDILDTMRSIYLERIHNSTIRVRKIADVEIADENPFYKPDNINQLQIFINFKCSYYHILSGKTNRVFGERDPAEMLAQLGLMDEDVYAVQYVSNQYIQHITGAYNDVLNNLKVDEQVEIRGKWWKVRKVIPDSEGVQETVLAVQ